jgi:hypothetical protein
LQCKSWFKRNIEDGRVVALWPGSAIHAQKVMETVCFEDFVYEYLDDNLRGNKMSWLGNGLTVAQEVGDPTTSYLDTVDVPPPIVEGVELWQTEETQEMSPRDRLISNGIDTLPL